MFNVLRLLSIVALTLTNCSTHAARPFELAMQQIHRGEQRKAIETLSQVPWSSPDVTEARWLMSELVTQIERGRSALAVDHLRVTSSIPQDSLCFTEGFEKDQHTFLESCGLYGKSEVRRVDAGTGEVLFNLKLQDGIFAEGLTKMRDTVFVLTWKEQIVIKMNQSLGEARIAFSLPGEGWGLTHDETSLIYSDGSNEIRFIDPGTGRLKRSIHVFNRELPLVNMNELEYADGEILANIYMTDKIARINPVSGNLIGWIVVDELPQRNAKKGMDVMNGIAYDQGKHQLFVTGKWWSRVYVLDWK